MRRVIAGVIFAAVSLAACTNKVDGNWVGAGFPADDFINPRIAANYVPLHAFSLPGMRRGAATIIDEGVAVTNAHNANLVDEADIIGRAPSGEDLMFIRIHEEIVGGPGPLPTADPDVGQDVILYGQGAAGSLRMAQGPVLSLREARFTITANAGPGFSGGPVVDAKDGHLVGITFAYYDAPNKRGPREMLAYRISWVMEEYRTLLAEKEEQAAAQPIDPKFDNPPKDFVPESSVK